MSSESWHAKRDAQLHEENHETARHKNRQTHLRPFSIKDADLVQEMAGNFNVAKMTMNVPHPYLPGKAEQWINDHPLKWESRTGASYAITSKQTKELFGAIGLVSIENGQASIGYWIGEPFWGNGYCSEAGAGLVQYGFSSLGLDRVYAEHLSINPASGRVMQNIGMKHYKTEKKPDRDGKSVRMELYEIERT